MRLRYETGVATLIQLVIMMALYVASGVVSIVADCIGNGAPECVSNGLVSLILILLQAIWFSFLAAVGYAAQDKRSRKLAGLLIMAQFITLFVSLFEVKQSTNNIFILVINLVGVILAGWVIYLGYRLVKAKGGRITSSARSRRKRLSTTSKSTKKVH